MSRFEFMGWEEREFFDIEIIFSKGEWLINKCIR